MSDDKIKWEVLRIISEATRDKTITKSELKMVLKDIAVLICIPSLAHSRGEGT